MTDLLDDKIRLLMVLVVEASPTTQELEETMELRLSKEPDPAVAQLLPQVDQPRRPWLVAVASAAAVLLLVGGAALLLRVVGSDTPVATMPADPSSSLTWSRVSYDEVTVPGDSSPVMRSVTVGGPGLVAVGSARDYTIPQNLRGAVWTSVDGTEWSRVPHDQAVFGGGSMNSVTAGGPGLVAVGTTDAEGDDPDAAVWTSVDGIDWSRIPHDETVFGLEETPRKDSTVGMSSVAVGGPGLVAVGSDFMTLDSGRWVIVAAVWSSVDGIDWSRVPHNEEFFAAPPVFNHEMNSITTGSPGLVAVGTSFRGYVPDGGGESDAAVWVADPGQ
jgi:hypothetical protein